MINARAVSVRLLDQEQRGPLPSQAIDGQLADRSLVIGQSDALVHESDPLMATLGGVDDGTLPGLRRQGTQATDHRGTTPADRDEVDATLVDAREFGIGDHL